MMKNTFNAMLKKRPKGQKVNEIYLFRLMARYLYQTAIKCTFVKQIHAQYYVSYNSNILHGQSKRVELGDLQIFTYDRSKKELRICTLQQIFFKHIHVTRNMLFISVTILSGTIKLKSSFIPSPR